MSANQSQIDIPYEELNRAARVLQAQGEAVLLISTQLRARANELHAAWEGAAEMEFMAQFASCQNRLARTPILLAFLSQGLLGTVSTLAQAEVQAQAVLHNTITADNS